MRNTTIRHPLVAFLGLALAASLALGQNSAPSKPGSSPGGAPSTNEAHLQADGSFTGTVASPSETGSGATPVTGGKVSLIQNGQVVATAQIQPDGTFSFPSVQPGTYTVIAQGTSTSGGTVGVMSVNILPFDPTLASGATPFQIGVVPAADASLLTSLQTGAGSEGAAAGAAAGGGGGAAGGAGGSGLGALGGLLGAGLGGLGAGMSSSGGGTAGGGGGQAVSTSTPQ